MNRLSRRRPSKKGKRKQDLVSAHPVFHPAYFETVHDEKKKPSSFILFGVAGAVILTLLGIFVFRPKKAEPPSSLQPAAETERVASDIPQNLPSRLEEQESVAKPPPKKEVAKKARKRACLNSSFE